MALLRPDELEKLRNYITTYLAKHNSVTYSKGSIAYGYS